MADFPAKLRPEDKVNKRAGHIAVSYRGSALVWGGYLENSSDTDQYWNSTEIMIYNSLTGGFSCSFSNQKLFWQAIYYYLV